MLHTITLKELEQALAQARRDYGDEAGDMLVCFTSSYGDRGRTEQAHSLRGVVDEVTLRESAYSDSGYAVADEDDDHDRPMADDSTTVLRIR